MENLDSTLGEIQRLEKSASADETPPAFSVEVVAKFAEASKIFKAALEAAEKDQPEEVRKTSHGEAIAIARAAMLNLEGTMSLIWEENGLNDVIRSQFKNVIGLLEPMTRSSTDKAATEPAPVDPKPDETPAASDAPATEPTPTAKGSAADAADEKNKPEEHSEGNGGDPASPEKVIWPRDLNTKDFRKNEQKEEKSTWGEDPKPKATV